MTLIAPVAPPPRAAPLTPAQTTPRRSRSDATPAAGPARGRGSLWHRVPRRALAAAGVVVLLCVVVVVVNAARSASSASVKTVTTTVFAPAAAGAPLANQLSSLRQIVSAAAKR